MILFDNTGVASSRDDVFEVLPAKEAAEPYRRLAAGSTRGRLVPDFTTPL